MSTNYDAGGDARFQPAPGFTTATTSIVPVWAVGRHVTAFMLTPQSFNTSSGVMSDVTAIGTLSGTAMEAYTNLYGHLESIEIDQRITTEDMSNTDSIFENQVPTGIGTSYVFTELEKSRGINKLAGLCNLGYVYYKVAITRGGQSWTGYGVLQGYNHASDKRSSKGRFTLGPVHMAGATANPNYG